MQHIEIYILFIAIGLGAIFLLIANLYLGLFLVILIQPLFISGFHEGGWAAKGAYIAVFVIWFGVWAFPQLFNRGQDKGLRWHPMAAPAVALGCILAIAIVIGLFYGSPILDILRDLSPYVGYLAVLPVLDIVRTPRQAKKVVIFLGIIGLPNYVMGTLAGIGVKQGIGSLTSLPYLRFGASYWMPIQGAFWGVALCAEGGAKKLVGWGSVMFASLTAIFGGHRGRLLSFFGEGIIAFFAAGRLAPQKKTRYLVPVFGFFLLLALLASQAGLVRIGLSKETKSRYGTLLSADRLKSDYSFEGRFLELKALLSTFAQEPVLGVGLGYHLKFKWYDESTMEGVWFQYHNGYGETLMKFGIIGTFVFCWYYLAAIKMAYRIITTGNSFFSRAIAMGLVIYMFIALVSSFSGSSFSDRGFALTIGVYGGLLKALANQNPYSEIS